MFLIACLFVWCVLWLQFWYFFVPRRIAVATPKETKGLVAPLRGERPPTRQHSLAVVEFPVCTETPVKVQPRGRKATNIFGSVKVS